MQIRQKQHKIAMFVKRKEKYARIEKLYVQLFLKQTSLLIKIYVGFFFFLYTMESQLSLFF